MIPGGTREPVPLYTGQTAGMRAPAGSAGISVPFAYTLIKERFRLQIGRTCARVRSMTDPKLIIKKRPRGEYEIGTFTQDGAIVAHVSVWDGKSLDTRTEEERQDAALAQAKRLLKALEATLAEA
jgi:hypothetical protein